MKLQTLLLILACALVLWAVYANLVRPEHPYSEGFTQDAPYKLKTGADVYDPFYAGVHDVLFCNDERAARDIDAVFAATEPSVNQSRILDMGSGTGCLIVRLRQRGYRAYGIDLSDAMSDIAEARCGACDDASSSERIINRTDFNDAMAFEKGAFSHVFCTGFTLYETKDKATLFANARSWLRPGGHFFVHVADPAAFSRTIPIARPALNAAAPADVKRCRVDFDGYTYEAEYEGDVPEIVLREKFTDLESRKVRENDTVLSMVPPVEVEQIARDTGFILKGKARMSKSGDKNQFIYTFER